ncbi:hypothetical protein SAMN03159306_03140, partial [Pseudomonas sp. NFACC48-1]
PSQAHSINLIHRVAGFQGRFAPQREQAPSPRELGMARVKGMPRVSVSLKSQSVGRPGCFCGEGACSRWAAQQPLSSSLNQPDPPRRRAPGPLRAPAGASSLATGNWARRGLRECLESVSVSRANRLLERDAFVARELAPAGLRSSPSQAHSINLIHRVTGFQGRFAPQREQAPSPRGIGHGAG